jgi:predicted GNAT superfamily acetyltransferase
MLNIGRLGVICRTYLRNVYGEMSDELNRGLPTDRFEVEWWADSSSPYSPRDSAAEPHRSYLEHIPNTAREVRAPLLGEAPEEAPAGFLPANEIVPSPLGLPAPGRWQIVEGQGAAVAVPGNFQRLKARDLDLAQAWRLHSRAVFEAYFAAGFVVIDFLRRGTGDDSIGVYLLARTEHTAPGT